MRLTLLLCSFLLPLTLMAGEAKAKVFGKKPTLEKSMPLSQALDKFDEVSGKDIAVTGKVKKVCKMKGCWMVIEDGKTSVRTTFKDYGFFVPKEILDKPVIIQGKLVEKEISVSMAKHLLKDEGAPQSEIDKVKKPKKAYQFVASGVEISK